MLNITGDRELSIQYREEIHQTVDWLPLLKSFTVRQSG